VFSPDGKSIAFISIADRAIKRVSIGGGAPVTICQDVVPVNMSWTPDGILFSQIYNGVQRVSPNGGKPETLVRPANNEQIQAPQILPGGQTILFTVAPAEGDAAIWDKAKIVVQNLKSGERKTLIDGGSNAQYLPTGHVVYALRGVLLAQPFDLHRLEITGGAVPIVEGVVRGGFGIAQFAFSNNGSLIYLPGPVSGGTGDERTLALVDRDGGIVPLKIPSGAYGFTRASRDGTVRVNKNETHGVKV
jgi:hypothetical protein